MKEKTFQYVTISDFVDTVGDGISFSKGQKVEVRIYEKFWHIFETLLSDAVVM